jgi:hypothetical protein
MNAQTAINREKEKLIKKAKKNGFYENFGDKEARMLLDKFPDADREILEFEKWCWNVTDKDLK